MTSPNAALQNTIGPVGSGQNTAPALNAPAPIDPSSMQRAYAALGLPYSNQSPAQTHTPPAQPAQTQHQQQMRPMNALGNRTRSCTWTRSDHTQDVSRLQHDGLTLRCMRCHSGTVSLPTGTNQMGMSGGVMGVPTSDQAKLHPDGNMPSTLNANK